MVTVRLARKAMACRFELVLHGEDEPWLRAAGEEALREIERLEEQLSIFRTDSDVSRINARAAREPVTVEPRLFRLLQQALRLYQETQGAFDLTVSPLMQTWGLYGDGGHIPDRDDVEKARRITGMNLVELNESDRTVRFLVDGVRLDFGAIGKGFAIDEAIFVLREAGVQSAFLHGGTSTMFALGRPLDGPDWCVAIAHPDAARKPVAMINLNDESLSVSAVWGKFFEVDGLMLGHVLDPRLGRPVEGAVLAAAAGPSAADADAISTALLVDGHPSKTCRSLVMEADTYTINNSGLAAPGASSASSSTIALVS